MPSSECVPRHYDCFTTTVVAENQEISEEQRIRVSDWLQANGVDTKDVTFPITIQGRIYNGQKHHQVIVFNAYHRDETGARYADPRDNSTAMKITLAVRMRVDLALDPQISGVARAETDH